jgi:hypothetical protein
MTIRFTYIYPPSISGPARLWSASPMGYSSESIWEVMADDITREGALPPFIDYRADGNLRPSRASWANDPDIRRVEQEGDRGYKRLYGQTPTGKATNQASRAKWRKGNLDAGLCRDCTNPRVLVMQKVKGKLVEGLARRCRSCLDKTSLARRVKRNKVPCSSK